MTAATIISPAPASASTTNVHCNLSIPYPRPNASGTLVSADAFVTCFGGAASAINLTLDLSRDGVVVDSTLTGGTIGASAFTVASCVPGNYVAMAWATVWYPFGNIPGSDSMQWQSPTVYISCTAQPVPLVVASPGNQSMFLYDPAALQMTVTGGTAPYAWSATGLPSGLSINSSTGLISGTGTRVGSSTVTVTAVDAAGRSGSTQFTWNVRREPCPRC
jgi:hypothetical protein